MRDPLWSWAGAQPRRLQAGFRDILQQMPSFVDPTCPPHSCHGVRGWADLLSELGTPKRTRSHILNWTRHPRGQFIKFSPLNFNTSKHFNNFYRLRGTLEETFKEKIHWEGTVGGTLLCFLHWEDHLDATKLCFSLLDRHPREYSVMYSTLDRHL